MSESGKAVFLSYASQDAEAARRICETLRAAGVEVWFDQNELVGGDAWDAKIRKQIAECALFVPVISAATQARREGYFRLEWRIAAQRTHMMSESIAFLLPVVIDATRDAEADVPGEFKAVQWTRLPAGESPEKFCARVGALLGGPVADRAPSHRPGLPPTRPSPRSRLVPAMIGVALLIAVAGYFALRPKRSPEEVAQLNAGRQTAAADAAAKSAPTAIADSPAPAPLSESRKLTLKARALIDDDLMAARENFRLAEELCQRAVTLAPDDGEAWATLARVSCEIMARNYETTTRRREVARSAADRAVRLAPESVEAGLAEAAYLVITGEFVAAEARLHRLLPIAANDERVAIAYARMLSLVKGREAAEDFWRTHPALGGNSARVLAAHAWALRYPGNYARAQELVDRAQAITPSRTGYFTKLLLLVVDYADMDRAKIFAERLPPQLAQEDIFASLISRVWLRLGDASSALAVLNRVPQDFFEESRRVEPKGYLKGRALELSGKAIAAEAEWKAALAVVERRLVAEPNRPPYLRAKALLQALTHQPAEAERTRRLFTEVSGARSRFDLLEMNLTHIEILLAANRVDDAIAELLAEKGWSDNPDPGAVNSLHYDPWFAPLRKDARVQALIASCEASRDQQLGRTQVPAAAVTARADAKPAAADKSVAVLAFANLSDDKSNEYFSDGISEELLNVLAKVPGLKVSARTSAFHFKGKDTPIPEIAKQLGVAYLVEGSVRKAGDKVRITAQLIKAADGFQVWSDTFTRDLKDAFAVQDEIAGLIATALSLKIGAVAARAEVPTEAYELYIRAREAWNLRNPSGYDQAEALLNRSLEIAPRFAKAHAALADVWALRAEWGSQIGRYEQRDSIVVRTIREKVDLALTLDPQSAEAHASLGLLGINSWRFTEAEQALRSAIRINPNYASAHQWLGRVLLGSGRMDEALAAFKRASELDPLSRRILDNYAWGLNSVNRPREALIPIGRALELQPDAQQARLLKAWILTSLGRDREAATLALSERLAKRLHFRVIVLARTGERAAAEEQMAAAKEDTNTQLLGLGVMGRRDDALAALRPGGFDFSGIDLIYSTPELDSIRTHPQFRVALAEVGLLEAHDRAQAWRAAHPAEKVAK